MALRVASDWAGECMPAKGVRSVSIRGVTEVLLPARCRLVGSRPRAVRPGPGAADRDVANRREDRIMDAYEHSTL